MVSNDKRFHQQRNDQNRQKAIGKELRRRYEDTAAEPIPDSFLRLLEDADRKLKP